MSAIDKARRDHKGIYRPREVPFGESRTPECREVIVSTNDRKTNANLSEGRRKYVREDHPDAGDCSCVEPRVPACGAAWRPRKRQATAFHKRRLPLLNDLDRSRAPTQRCLMKLPVCSSDIAWRNCSCVFITIGPYQATGSSIGLPDTSRNRIPSGPAWTVSSSPRSNRTSE